jgi:hypothetical protein
MDQFLQPAETPLTTISILPETEYLEGLLKSLNISDTLNGINKTILAPINEAWPTSIIPFGTLVHNLKYLVIDGVYTSDQLIEGVSLPSDYKKLKIQFGLNGTKALMVNGNQAQVVKTDILTTNGVIHLIDQVLNADAELIVANKNGTTVTITSGPSPPPVNGGPPNTLSSPMGRRKSLSSCCSTSCSFSFIIVLSLSLSFLL